MNDIGGTDPGLPSPEQQADEILASLRGRRLMVLLDYDGTLSPIAPRPEAALLPEATRSVLERLADRWPTAVISGRSLANVRDMVGLAGVVYAGNHGLEIEGPEGSGIERYLGDEFAGEVREAAMELERALAAVEGSLVEDKGYSLSVHYRLVAEGDVATVESAVDEAVGKHSRLRKKHGKMVFELRPDLDWDKGRAVRWLIEVVDGSERDVLPIYVGDDVTDEDAFRALEGLGVGVLISETQRPTAATHRLRDTDEACRFLDRLATGEAT